jgi:hypothetical protein
MLIVFQMYSVMFSDIMMNLIMLGVVRVSVIVLGFGSSEFSYAECCHYV